MISMDTERSQALRLGFLAGVIDRNKVPTFELMLWRICRGNVFLRTADIDEVLEDPKTVSDKSTFFVY